MLMHPWLLESSQRKVNMAKWIREVWNWEQEKRGRVQGLTAAAAAGAQGERRPSAARVQERTSSMTRA